MEAVDHRMLMVQEMRSHNYDSIRFASYRTAIKLRFVQKKAFLNNIDIWNVIETFRENGLNTLDASAEVNVSRLETLISSLYHSLNKRLPPAQQVLVESCTGLLLNWLLAAYNIENVGKIRVFSIKVALATLCAGKLMDKLRYMFSLLSDANGHLILYKFDEYLREVLALPAAVYESPSFNYSPELAQSIFSTNAKISVNDFMDVMMSEPGPPHCLVWLPLLHRLASVETVVHHITCDACQKENFMGFRYKCQKCHNYQMCQDCFWRGQISGSHLISHQVKEYTSYKSPSKQMGHSLRKSFRCVHDKQKPNIPRFPEEPEKTLNLSHIVPPSPLPSHNGFSDASFSPLYDSNSMDNRSHRSVGHYNTARYTSSLDSRRAGSGGCVGGSDDDEHRLIARYAARLAAGNSSHRAVSEGAINFDSSRAQRELIAQLEGKNREIMREIARLRRQQELEGSGGMEESPALVSELRALRLRKDELETHLMDLQDSRKQLMVQLEGLMKMLKNNQTTSPHSTSPRSGKSPPIPGSSSSRSAPPTPGGTNNVSVTDLPVTDVRSAFGSYMSGSNTSLSSATGGNRSLRNDLLVAADSVTNAMSTLVRELNSEGSDPEQEDSHLLSHANPFDRASGLFGNRRLLHHHNTTNINHFDGAGSTTNPYFE